MKHRFAYLLLSAVLCLSACAEAQDETIPNVNQTLIAEDQLPDRAIPKPLLKEALWRNRLLIICSANSYSRDSMLARINPDLDAGEFYERDLILVDVDQESAVGFVFAMQESGRFARIAVSYDAERDAIAKLTQCKPDEESIALIGKDGGLKQRWKDLPPMSEVYALIDAMPMRIQEMKRKE